MNGAGDRTPETVAGTAYVRRAGRAFRLGAVLWFVHCGSVLVIGPLIIATLSGARVDPALYFFSSSLAISTASSGAIELGLGLRTLSKLSIRLPDLGFEAVRDGPTDGPNLQVIRRQGSIAGLLCFLHAGIGVVALALLLFGPDSTGLAGTIALSNLWFLAFVFLALAGVFGGDFLERVLVRLEIQADPLHLFRWYAGLTAFFSNLFVLALGFVLGRVCGAVFLLVPFGVVPLLGIEAFRRIFHVGSLLARTDPLLLLAKLGSSGSASQTQLDDP